MTCRAGLRSIQEAVGVALRQPATDVGGLVTGQSAGTMGGVPVMCFAADTARRVLVFGHRAARGVLRAGPRHTLRRDVEPVRDPLSAPRVGR
jgi:hypothetical protein